MSVNILDSFSSNTKVLRPLAAFALGNMQSQNPFTGKTANNKAALSATLQGVVDATKVYNADFAGRSNTMFDLLDAHLKSGDASAETRQGVVTGMLNLLAKTNRRVGVHVDEGEEFEADTWGKKFHSACEHSFAAVRGKLIEGVKNLLANYNSYSSDDLESEKRGILGFADKSLHIPEEQLV